MPAKESTNIRQTGGSSPSAAGALQKVVIVDEGKKEGDADRENLTGC